MGTVWHSGCVARWLRCLHCRLTARRSWVRFPHGALLALEGRSSSDLQCSGGLSPGLFCVEFACSPHVHRGEPQQKTHAKEQNTLRRSLTKTDSSPHLVTGRLTPAHCSWGPGGGTVRDRINAEDKFTNDLRPACVCVCVRVCVHVCVCVCVCVTERDT